MCRNLAIILFALFSLGFLNSCSEDETSNDTYSASGMVIDVPDGVPLEAGISSRAENAWAFVRQSATWGDGNSRIVDQLLVAILNTGLLQNPGSFTDTDSVLNGQSATIRLTTDQDSPVDSASAFTGTKTFSRKFEIWRNSDNAKALEMYFDSATELGDDGVLLIYQLNVLAPNEFDGDDVIVESYTFDSSDGVKQTYSWSGGAIVNGGTGQAGRVILERMDNDTLFCFKTVVKLDGTNDWCAGANAEYYSLGYTQKLTDNGEVTAKFGFRDNAVDNTGEICTTINNPLNYGLFNNSGFVDDGVASPAATYPDTTRVDTLFSGINTAGDGAWDDTRQATIDNLNIQFVDSSAP